MNEITAPNLAPSATDRPHLPQFEIPLVEATAGNLQAYGEFVDRPEDHPIEIVRWPAQGWRPVDPDTGDQSSTTEGEFDFYWRGNTLHAHNSTVPGPFISPLALPGDDLIPESFTAFWFSGEKGLYIHPGVWHEAEFPVNDSQKFFDKQGKVHARISVDFTREFGMYLSAPLKTRSW